MTQTPLAMPNLTKPLGIKTNACGIEIGGTSYLLFTLNGYDAR